MENASSDVIAYIDGDYTYDPKKILDVVKPVLEDKCDARAYIRAYKDD